MRYSELIPLVASMVNFALAFFVFSRSWRSTMNRVYLLWGISLAIWNFGTYFMFRVPLIETPENHAEALFWAKFLQFGVIFLPVTLFHIGFLIAKVPTGRKMPLLYFMHCVFALSNFGSFFVNNVRIAVGVGGKAYAWYSTGGPGFFIFSAVCGSLSLTTMYVLFKQLQFLPPIQRIRVKSLIFGCAILVFFGYNDILPILGIYNYPGTRVPIYPLGSFAAIFYGIVAAHSILQHQLLDVHVTLGRIAARLVRLSFMVLVCLALLLIVQTILPGELPRSGLFIVMAVLVVSAIIASNFFPRLFGNGSDALERRILGDQFEYHDKIQGFIQSLPWYTDNKLLMDDFHDLLVKTVRVQRYHIVLLDETSRKFSLFRSFPEGASNSLIDIERDSPVFQHFYATKDDCLILGPEHRPDKSARVEQLARKQLEQFDAELCYSFYSDDDPVGLLLLDKKASEEPYTPHDLHLLRSVVKNLSLIMNQIRLKQRVLIAEEMELLGRMSRGMAHDLNNLITPISTYLQLANETARQDDASYELLPTVTRNVETIQSYIKESLFYSNTLTPHFFPGRLDQTVLKAIEVVSPQLQEKGIQVKHGNLPAAELEMDSVLIQRMVSNLLGNAGDASPRGAEIEVQIARLARTEASRDWFRLKVIDHGMGISRENLPHVFRPYFTTKDRGSTQRGFGLGLAICRKIVLLHGGNLNIASEEKKGTTVEVDLPSRKIEHGRQNPVLAQVSIA
jgi:signal transduction histidine kinase